jgi:hypothetical protein
MHIIGWVRVGEVRKNGKGEISASRIAGQNNICRPFLEIVDSVR